MTQQPNTDRWAFLKHQAPILVLVLGFVGFMKADQAAHAALFGMLAMFGIAWQIYRGRVAHKTHEPPVMQLGQLRAVGPTRMRPWHYLAVLAFSLLGLALFFTMGDANLPARLGMTSICFAIAGAWLAQINPRLRNIGVAVLGLGFSVAGVLFFWEAVSVLRAGGENAALTAVKWAVFSAFMLIAGIPMTLGTIFKRGRTPIYRDGIAGPHGFVRWTDAERIELVESEGQSLFALETRRGWTLWIDVPTAQRDSVADFLTQIQTPDADVAGRVATA